MDDTLKKNLGSTFTTSKYFQGNKILLFIHYTKCHIDDKIKMMSYTQNILGMHLVNNIYFNCKMIDTERSGHCIMFFFSIYSL